MVELVQLIKEQNRQPDFLSRYGGEEFIVLSTNTDLEGAKIQAERLREKIMHHNFNSIPQVTCSFGIAEYHPQNNREVISNADAALYRAKQNGRNRVEVNTRSLSVE